jgi:ABC-2 type transport system permease protein
VIPLFDFVQLIRNELMKIFERLRTWVFMILLIFGTFVTAFLLKFIMRAAGMEENLWGLAYQCTHLLPVAEMFAVVIAGEIVSGEFSWGTVKLLLIRPVNRTKILWSKYVAAVLVAFMLVLILFVSSLLFGMVFFGFAGGEREVVKNVFTEYANYSVDLIMMVTLAFMLSALSRSNSLAIGLSIFFLFAGTVISEILRSLDVSWGKYLLFSNTDFSQYSNGEPMFKGMTPAFSVTVLVIYFVLFQAVAWWSFTKRDVSL